MIDAQILPLLRCLQTRSPLREADEVLCARVNRALANGQVFSVHGRRLTDRLDGALVNAEGTVLYPIRQGIPQLLVDELITLSQLDASRPEEPEE